MIRRRENPGQFGFAIGFYGVILFGFTYAALYLSIPWPNH